MEVYGREFQLEKTNRNTWRNDFSGGLASAVGSPSPLGAVAGVAVPSQQEICFGCQMCSSYVPTSHVLRCVASACSSSQ